MIIETTKLMLNKPKKKLSIYSPKLDSIQHQVIQLLRIIIGLHFIFILVTLMFPWTTLKNFLCSLIQWNLMMMKQFLLSKMLAFSRKCLCYSRTHWIVSSLNCTSSMTKRFLKIDKKSQHCPLLYCFFPDFWLFR